MKIAQKNSIYLVKKINKLCVLQKKTNDTGYNKRNA